MLAVRVTAVLVDNGPKPHARKSAFSRGAAGAAGFPHLPAAPAVPSLPSHNESRTPRGSSAQLPRGVAAVPAPGLWHRLAETPETGTGTGTGTSPLRSAPSAGLARPRPRGCSPPGRARSAGLPLAGRSPGWLPLPPTPFTPPPPAIYVLLPEPRSSAGSRGCRGKPEPGRASPPSSPAGRARRGPVGAQR